MDSRADKAIIAILTPYFGDKMAEGVVQLSCQALRMDRAAIAAAQLPAISADIEKRMAIFLGTDKAASVAALVRAVKA
jgi:hypothetical protein